MKKIFPVIILSLLISRCSTPSVNESMHEPGTFGYDLAFLQKHDSVIILKEGEASVIISPKYQAKVFTSSANGMNGASFGWINYKAFEGEPDQHMNAYGGENRLWLGPEGGPFSLFFPKDSTMNFTNWKTPAAFDTEPWALKSRSNHSVSLEKEMNLANYAGTLLNLRITRDITLLDNKAINELLHIKNDGTAKAVGYQTNNILTNTGAVEWTTTTGMPCIWILDMFNPSDSSTIIIPYKEIAANEKPATTDYFGEIPADRIKTEGGILFFKADGKMRGKLGIHPANAKNIAGSYDADKKILTLVLFDIENAAPYLNQEWTINKPPFSGDALNAYNDGPLETGGQMGPFYELESVSPAAALRPGQSITHRHAVFHFTGEEKTLDGIMQQSLGISLRQVHELR